MCLLFVVVVEGGSGEARGRRGGWAKEEVEEADAGDQDRLATTAKAKDDGMFFS